jgi:predicted MPP superfamily phosphohydrolase
LFRDLCEIVGMIQWFCMLTGWAVADVLWWRAADRRLRRVPGARIWRPVVGAFAAAQLAYIGVLTVGSFTEHVLQGGMVWPVAAYVWHLFILPGSVLVLLAFEGVRRVRKSSPDQKLQNEPNRLTRRELMGALGVAAPPIITAGVTGVAVDRLGDFRVRDVELKLPTLPADLDGLTIAQVSDLHIGRFLPAGVMERVAEATNAVQADLVVFTGDLIDVSCEYVAPGIDFMKRLDRRHGLAVIEGNHDLMGGTERFEGPVRDAGVPLLLDATATFNVPGRSTPVQFMGITWGELKTGREMGKIGREGRRMYRDPKKEVTDASIRKVAGERRADAFPILLAHHPHAFDTAAALGLPLTLSGHTHGGQLMLTKHIGAGPLRFRYWTGEYAKPDGAKLFVNNGVGNWFPLRINAPAEIVKLTLRRG